MEKFYAVSVNNQSERDGIVEYLKTLPKESAVEYVIDSLQQGYHSQVRLGTSCHYIGSVGAVTDKYNEHSEDAITVSFKEWATLGKPRYESDITLKGIKWSTGTRLAFQEFVSRQYDGILFVKIENDEDMKSLDIVDPVATSYPWRNVKYFSGFAKINSQGYSNTPPYSGYGAISYSQFACMANEFGRNYSGKTSPEVPVKPDETVETGETVKPEETNPKQALGLSNIPMGLFSDIAIAYGSVAKLNGKEKYGLQNFIGTDVILSIYADAIRRHLAAFMAGEEHDPADGVPHLGAILANVDIILSARAAGTLIDDRSLVKGYRDEMRKLLPLVSSLQELHKDKNPTHYYLTGAKKKC